MVCIGARELLSPPPQWLALRPSMLQVLHLPPADVGALDNCHFSGDQSDHLIADDHVLGVLLHIRHPQLHAHGGQPVPLP